MKTSRSFVAALLGALLISTAVGCAAPTEEDAQNGDAISAKQAAANEGFDMAEMVLEDEPASAANTEKLGVASWSVFTASSAKANFTGTVAYAVDGDGDVKYALTVNGNSGQIGFYRFAKDGTKASVDAKAHAEAYAALYTDIQNIAAKLKSSDETGGIQIQTVADDRRECAFRVGAILLAGVVLAGAAWTAPIVAGGILTAGEFGAAIGAGAAVPTLASTTAISATYAGVVVGGAVTASAVIKEVRQVVWTDTVKVCKSAVRGH